MQAKQMRLWALGIVAAAVAAAVLPPFINIGRYKGRIAASIGQAVGRPVTVDSVELRLLPQPGFYMENVSIGDDPRYSAEPILHADEVTAYLRLSSLWRGRLEIARLDLNYPSLNLVERDDESWNLESLLWRATQTTAAPTTAPVTSRALRFPYIAATNGRINFKYGLEKSVFSLTDADFSLFSPAENQWRMRIEAHPVRTDMPVTDTGTLKGEVNIQRAATLRDAPVKANFTWERLQLGNLTRLIYGEDRGWRGELDTSAQLTGTPGALKIATASRLRDFRRYDIQAGNTANLNATCTGEIDASAKDIHGAECRLPLDAGVLTVRGAVRGVRRPRYDLTLSAESLPANAVLNIVRHAKQALPPDLTAQGTIAATFHGQKTSEAPSSWIGELSVSDFVLHSGVLGKDLSLPHITATAGTVAATTTAHHRGHNQMPVNAPRALLVRAFDLPLGAASPAQMEGLLDDERFDFHLKGDAHLERLQQFAQAAGIAAPRLALSGPAALDLHISANWKDFDNPSVTGAAFLKGARVEVPGLAAPVEIAAAHVEFDGFRMTVHNAAATVGKLSLTGGANFPRHCVVDGGCESTFDLATDEFNPERWNDLLSPGQKKRAWLGLLSRAGAVNNVMDNLHAKGHFTARRVVLDGSTGAGFETNFAVADGVLRLTGSKTEVFGGTVDGDWTLDFSGAAPKLSGEGTATRVQTDKLSTLLKGALGSGTVDMKYKLAMSGADAATLLHSAEGEASFHWNGGTLKVAPDGKAPMRVASGEGQVKLSGDGWSFTDTTWKTTGGELKFSGTISRDSALALVFTEAGGAAWKIGGTLQKPVLTAPETAAPTRRVR
ncbi:MAG: AsmA family protein [Acidobacteriota bacterium]|nr:AsmA family protein [Acidobacteriota bacterium]